MTIEAQFSKIKKTEWFPPKTFFETELLYWNMMAKIFESRIKR
jgi:hypothetical protein